MNEGVDTDGGFTVPEDIQQKLIHIERHSFHFSS